MKFDRKLYARSGVVGSLISDQGELKTDPTDQMEYSRKKRQNFERIYHDVGRPAVIAYKELCPWDPLFFQFCDRLSLGVVRFSRASLTSPEVHAMRDERGPVGKRRIGKNIGSRLISYYPIVFRICEQMIMGNILDAISLRSCNPMVVGHMNPVDYFQLMYEDKLQAGRSPHYGIHAVAVDIAGWDTRIGRRDLEMEHWFFNQFSDGTEHASLITGLYWCYSDHITLLKRPKGSQV